MSDHDRTASTEALSDVAYLSRSANRVAILEALTDGAATRAELTERTDTSRTTLDRIVNELEERGWAERTSEGTYAATAEGTHLMAQFRPFLESVAAIRRLGETVSWLPTEELTIDLRHFADATVERPAGADPAKTVDLMTELVRNASEFRALTHLVPPVPLARATRDGLREGRLTTEGVLTGTSIDVLRENPDRRDRWADIVETGGGLYQYDDPIACNLWIVDETVLIKRSGPENLGDSYGVPIVSENDTVRSWAHDLIDSYRDAATPLDSDAFAEATSATE
jgi:predicted transcriptional regulator